jgi:3-hydroxymyristoyl/3-hydroxydecanoyl-(acyl carrier protein) dehydratase
MISGNEEVFAGHFPGFKLWPGAYTLEGLAQSCNLLAILEEIHRRWLSTGSDARALVHAIRAIDLAYHMRPVGKLGDVDRLRELVGDARGCMGVVAAYDIKLIAPVFAGQRLDYEVVREPAVLGMLPFLATATVDGNVVARGTVTVSLMDAAWQKR